MAARRIIRQARTRPIGIFAHRGPSSCNKAPPLKLSPKKVINDLADQSSSSKLVNSQSPVFSSSVRFLVPPITGVGYLFDSGASVYHERGDRRLQRFFDSPIRCLPAFADPVEPAAFVRPRPSLPRPRSVPQALLLLIMYDASGVRLHAGLQAELLNQIVCELPPEHPMSSIKPLRDSLGHTPVQVIAGAMLGCVVALLMRN